MIVLQCCYKTHISFPSCALNNNSHFSKPAALLQDIKNPCCYLEHNSILLYICCYSQHIYLGMIVIHNTSGRKRSVPSQKYFSYYCIFYSLFPAFFCFLRLLLFAAHFHIPSIVICSTFLLFLLLLSGLFPKAIQEKSVVISDTISFSFLLLYIAQ